MELFTNFIALFTESAPFLLLGMFLAGVIHQCIPKTWVERTLGKNSSFLTAAVIGAPLPLCSCSVIPVAMGIRRSGATKASTASFLVATPETGIDSVGVTYALMGPIMAIARPIAAISSALVAGLLVFCFGSRDKSRSNSPANSSGCCHQAVHVARLTTSNKLTAVFSFGFGQLLRDFMLWFLLGIFFAALVTTVVPEGMINQYAQGVWAMLLVILLSIPMYVCATASTPIAVGLLLAGVTPGAALVFMLTGPATNIATLMVIKNELGKRELVLYLIAIVFGAICAGLLLDHLMITLDWQLQLAHGAHSGAMGLVYQASSLVLAILIGFQLQKVYLPKVRDLLFRNS